LEGARNELASTQAAVAGHGDRRHGSPHRLGGTSFAATLALPRNSVGTAQLKNNAVNSLKVANGSLLKADFKSSRIARS
jgi:hypothetical protein